jgi:hypothetical protein
MNTVFSVFEFYLMKYENNGVVMVLFLNFIYKLCILIIKIYQIMKMKFGAIVVDGRGKLGGHVASKNRAGAYLRTKVTPVNGRTSFQQNVRNIFGSLSQSWRGLTEAQRDSWNSGVSAYAKTDIFGDLKNPTGLALYQRLNNNLLQASETALTTCPAPEAVAICKAISVTAVIAGQAMVLTCDVDTPADSVLKISATPAVSPGRAFVKSEFRTLMYDSGNYGAGLSIATQYLAKFGAIAALGSKIFVQVTVINTNTGQAGVPSEVFTLIVAA